MTAEHAGPDPRALIATARELAENSSAVPREFSLALAEALKAALARAEKAEGYLDLVASHWSPPSSCLIEEAEGGWWIRFYRCPDKGPHPTKTAALLAWVGWLELKRCLAQKKGGI